MIEIIHMGNHASNLRFHNILIKKKGVSLIPYDLSRSKQCLQPHLIGHVKFGKPHSIPQLRIDLLASFSHHQIPLLVQIVLVNLITSIEHPLYLPRAQGKLVDEIQTRHRKKVHHKQCRQKFGRRPHGFHPHLDILHVLGLEHLLLVGFDGMGIEVVGGKINVLIQTINDILLEFGAPLYKLATQLGSADGTILGADIARNGLVAPAAVDSTVLALKKEAIWNGMRGSLWTNMG
jgi:hypothetical protein